MDLERIKQEFRHRSGRSKQLKKKNRLPVVAPTPEQQSLHTSSLSRDSPSTSTSLEAAVEEKASDLGKNKELFASTNGDSQDTVKEETGDNEKIEDAPSTQSGSLEERPSSSGTTTAPTSDQATETGSLPNNEQAPVDTTHKTNQSHMSTGSPGSEADSFDLNPPKPRPKPPSFETIAELLFSSGHLNAILHHPPSLARFSAFLQRYLPQAYALLTQYLETQKAIKAVEYANAVAEGLKPESTTSGTSTEVRGRAARLDEEFEKISQASFNNLVGDALPIFISYSLVRIASECLTNEIAGRATPIMSDLVGGLSEVFCLTDPKQEDNPIIYASEEFYRLTRYGPEETLNSNCRFLQGRKTNPSSVKRLRAAIDNGEEITETLLNYRRDGKPFINLLMVAPLHDRYGKLKYHIGAQVDVTGLVEGGRGLEGFQRYLRSRDEDQGQKETELERLDPNNDQERKQRALMKLRELSEMFDLEESAVVQAHSRGNSLDRDDEDSRSIGSTDRISRRVYIDSDASDDDEESDDRTVGEDNNEWKLGQAGDGRLSGKLPGVYDSFMLLRPAPSLRIVFISPKLYKYKDVLQTPFLSHVSAPNATLSGLVESLKTGVPVSAKIHFSTERGENRYGTTLRNGIKHEDGHHGRAIWISATPLIGEEDQIGVWMCVVCEKSKVKTFRSGSQGPSRTPTRGTNDTIGARGNSRNKYNSDMPGGSAESSDTRRNSRLRQIDDADIPIRPIRVDSGTILISSKTETKPPAADAAPAKTLNPQKSVYFDTIQNQAAPHEEVGMPERTENKTQDRAEHHETVNNDDSAPQTPAGKTVFTPIEEYQGAETDSKAYDVQTPSMDSPAAHEDSEDEYVTTRSPQAQPVGQGDNERIVIEEDSDVLEENDFGSDSVKPEIASSEAESRQGEDRSISEERHLPDGSQVVGETKEDLPTSRELPEHQERSEEQELLSPTISSHPEITPSTASQTHADDTEVDDAIVGSPSATRKDVDNTPAEHESMDKDTGEQAPPNEHEQFNSDTLSVSSRGGLDESTLKVQDEQTDTLNSHEHEHELEQEKDSSAPSDSPLDEKTHSRSDSPKASSSEHESTPQKSSNKGAADAYDIDRDGVEAQEHEQDIKNWVRDARPPSSRARDYDIKEDEDMIDHRSSATGMQMDYLRAGSNRWSNARAPRLGQQRISQANMGLGGAVGEKNDIDDLCADTPYSVD
ncbi:hypothetical protein LTR05_001258 [Lithohypha guttulata]|uniref:PAC domain-containing protein n=1 Tax=Lithohypha guttulata TaxID=1690604 RepID=A0AAN7T636_9EURO|nr:hypothetical protein LTR05_001258 [Lithohypha guttulata]